MCPIEIVLKTQTNFQNMNSAGRAYEEKEAVKQTREDHSHLPEQDPLDITIADV